MKGMSSGAIGSCYVSSPSRDLSSGTAAWREGWEPTTDAANTCTSVAGESERLLCVCARAYVCVRVFESVPGIFINASLG